MTATMAPERDDLGWLLATLEEWLLVAEPDTVRELGAFLRSIGSAATPADVLRQLARYRTMVRRNCTEE